MIHQGSCHCGRVAFDVEGEIKGAIACNRTTCSRRGSLPRFVRREKLRPRSPEDAASTYTFHQHVIKHRSCPTCGIHPYGEEMDPKGNPAAAVNLRCLEGVDPAAIPIKNFGGRSL